MSTECAAVCHLDSQYEELIQLKKIRKYGLLFCGGEFVMLYLAHNGIISYVNGFCTASEYCVRSTFGTSIVLLFVCLFVCLFVDMAYCISCCHFNYSVDLLNA